MFSYYGRDSTPAWTNLQVEARHVMCGTSDKGPSEKRTAVTICNVPNYHFP